MVLRHSTFGRCQNQQLALPYTYSASVHDSFRNDESGFARSVFFFSSLMV